MSTEYSRGPHPDLRPETLPDLDPVERQIADAIRIETERKRAEERAKEPPGGVPMGLLSVQSSRAAMLEWDVLLQDYEVVRQAAERAGTTRSEVVRVAREKCRPKHWRSVMWFSFNVELLDTLTSAQSPDLQAAAHRFQLETEAKVRKATASSGGKARSEPYREPKQFVQDQWAKHRDAYENNKSDFARTYVRIVNQQFGIEVTERTVRESWLKDIQ